jgi:hypothetical protein
VRESRKSRRRTLTELSISHDFSLVHHGLANEATLHESLRDKSEVALK